MNDKHYIGKSISTDKLERAWKKGCATWGTDKCGCIVILEIKLSKNSSDKDVVCPYILWAIVEYDDYGNWYIKKFRRFQCDGKGKEKRIRKFPPDVEKKAEVLLKSIISKRRPYFIGR